MNSRGGRSPLSPPPWIRHCTKIILSLSLITTQNLVNVSRTVRAYGRRYGVPKKLGDAVALLLKIGGMGDPVQRRHSTTLRCKNRWFLGQTVQAQLQKSARRI